MSTFELQVYKSGTWNVDSYFDDREIAMSEAERLNGSGRYAGIRVMQEDFDEASNRSSCRVVFSKMRQSEANQDWREQAKRAPMSRTGAHKDDTTRSTRRGRQTGARKISNARLYLGLVVGFIVLIAGVAAMIGLQEIAKYM